jgi:hypothetical protein
MISENQIKAVKKCLNSGIEPRIPYMFQEITPEQTDKGLAWLMREASKRNSPFNEKETFIINNFAKFVLVGFINDVNKEQAKDGLKWYVPVYRVIASNGLRFDYYYNFQRIMVIS